MSTLAVGTGRPVIGGAAAGTDCAAGCGGLLAVDDPAFIDLFIADNSNPGGLIFSSGTASFLNVTVDTVRIFHCTFESG